MIGLREVRFGMRFLFQRDTVERDLDEEMRFHIEMQTAQNVKRGMSPEAARTAALCAFGGVEKAKEECRRTWITRRLEELAQDVRYGLRSLGKSRGFSAVVVLTLALGIGANTAIFSAVHGVLLRPLPFAGGDRVTVLRQQEKLAGLDDVRVSPLEMADYRARSRTLSGIAEYHTMSFNLLNLVRHGAPERVRTGVVSANFFQVLGVTPRLGRDFTAEDEKASAVPVLVLSYEYWQRSQGGDPAVIGRTLEMNDKAHTVIGVLPPVPQYPDTNDVYMPTTACPFRSIPQAATNRRMRMARAIARLKPGASLAQASAEIGEISRQMQREHPEDYPASQGYAASLFSLREELTRGARPTLLILLATVGLVLLIVCANVANLTLARQVGRERELAVRAALGADRGRLARQLLTESTLLACTGGVLGLLLAAGALRLLVTFVTRFTPRAGEISIDGPVLLFTLGVSLLTGLAFGALPAWSRHEPADALKEGGDRSGAGGAGLRLRNGLIVAQLALSFMLLIGAGLMLRSLLKLHQVDPGFHTDRVLTAGIDLNWSRYNNDERQSDFYRRLLPRLSALPGVTSAAFGSTFPLNDSRPWNNTLRIEGRPLPEGQAAPLVDLRVASPEYFRTIGVPLLAGRAFTDGDDAAAGKAAGVAVINQSMARHFWGSRDPLGQRISFDSGETWRTVVGVVGDVKQYGLDRAVTDEVYRPLEQFPQLGGNLLLRTSGSPQALESGLRDALRAVDPEQPLFGVRTLEEARTESLAAPRLTATLLGLFALLALVITATGIAGLIAFSVSRRTHEIGIRMALGAVPGSVLWMVLQQGAVLVLSGLALGIAGALAFTRVLSNLLFQVQPTDPLTFLTVFLTLLTVAAVACLVPARRATSIQPIVALRSY
jgi:putative ABC transport system permease protein